MTSTTLTRTLSATLDASGNGTITLRPDVGQNWAPLFVRISTSSRKTPAAYCAVYHGSPGVPIQQSQFIDDTFTADGDSSSIIAGTPIVYGEAIIFSFQSGTPGDTAVATVYGLQSDLPPNLDLVPQVPGTHFSGHLQTEVLSTVATVPNTAPITIGSLTTGPFDTRQWGSYYLKVYATTFGAAATVDVMNVTLTWAAKSDGSDIIFQDQMEWIPDSAFGGAYTFSGGPVEFQDVHHGPYLSINFANTATLGDSLHFSYTLTFTTRVLPSPFQKQQGDINGVVINSGVINVPAGGTVNFPWNFTYGRISLHMNNGGAAALNCNRMQGSIGAVEAFTMAAGATQDRELILPKLSTWWTISAPGAASSFNMYAVTLLDKV